MTDKDGSTQHGPESSKQQKELSAYEKLLEHTKAQVEKMTSVVDADEFKKIIDRSAEELKKVGGHSREAINKANEALKKDLATTTEHMKSLGRSTGQAFDTMQHAGADLWVHLSRGTGTTWETWRNWSAGATAEFMKNVSAWSAKVGERLDESLVYHSEEMTHGGSFTCEACGEELKLDQPGHLPACSKCQNETFRRS